MVLTDFRYTGGLQHNDGFLGGNGRNVGSTLNYLDQNELFSATFFDPGYKPALQFCGTHSGKDCDKAQRTGLQPVLLEGTTSFAQARRVLICRKRYTAMLQPEGFLEPETYEKWYGKDPMHREFVGEVLAYYERMH